MTLKTLNLSVLAICLNMALCNGMAVDKNKKPTIATVIPACDSNVKNVIFDLGEVLFTAPKSKRRAIILPMILQYPSLIYTLCTRNIKKDLFKILSDIPAQTSSSTMPMYNDDEQMPQIMVDWMTGRPHQEILTTVQAHIAQLKNSTAEKALFTKITQLMFEPNNFVEAMEPIEPMVKLVKALKANNYRLYVLSNWDHESFPLMRKKHNRIFDMFDGTLISGTEKTGKPDIKFYKKLLRQNKIKAHESIFIDDEPHNITAANKVGIYGIRKTSTLSVCEELEKLGVLKLSS